MPGSFPFGNIFSTFGSFLSGSGGNQQQQQQDQSESSRGQYTSDSNAYHGYPQTTSGARGTDSSTHTRREGEDDQQGLPDLDLDLD